MIIGAVPSYARRNAKQMNGPGDNIYAVHVRHEMETYQMYQLIRERESVIIDLDALVQLFRQTTGSPRTILV